VSRTGRRWLIAAGAVALLLVVLLIALPLWILHSDSGRDFALRQLQAQLAPDTLTVERAEGTLSGPLRLHGLRYRSADGLTLEIERAELAYRWRDLLGRRLWIESLQAEGLALTLPPADAAAAEPFSLPEQLPWPELQLPIDIRVDRFELADLTVLPADAAEPIGIDRLHGAIDWTRGESLVIDALQLDAEAGRLTLAGQLGLGGRPQAQLDLDWQAAGAPQPLRLTARDIDDALQLQLDFGSSGALALSLQSNLAWQLEAALIGFRPADWWPEASNDPLDLALSGHGDRRQATLQGSLRAAGRQLLLEPSEFAFDPDTLTLTLAPLQLALDDGSRLRLQGPVSFADGLQLALSGEAAPLRLPIGEDDAAAFVGTLQADGPLDALQLRADGRLTRADLDAELKLQGELGGDHFALERLQLSHRGGRLDARGRVGWQPQPSWQIEAEFSDFDPGVLATDWSGRIGGRLASEGQLGDEGVSVELTLDAVRGQLRGRPLAASGRLSLGPGGGDADLAVQLGDSRLRVRGAPSEQLDLAIELDPLQLADFVDQGKGELRGRLRLQGVGAAARLSGTLSGSALDYAGQRAQRLQLTMSAPLDFSAPGTLQLRAEDLRLQDEPLDWLELELDGGPDGLRVTLDLAGPRVELAGEWQGRQDTDGWRGELQQLSLRSGQVPQLRLQQPVLLAIGEQRVELGEACLAAEQGSLCARLNHAGVRQELRVELRQLPLALAEPWIAAADRPLGLSGALDGEIDLQIVDGRPEQGRLALSVAEGSLIQPQLAAEPQTLVSWRELQLDGRLDGGRLQLDARAVIDDDGRLQLRLAGGSPFADPEAAIDGRVELHLPQLRLLALLPETVVAPRGQLQLGLDLSGRWSAPTAAGVIELAALAAELPALGITLSESRLELRGDQNELRIDGRINSGGGVLTLDGTLADLLGAPQLALSISGQNVRLIDTTLVKAIASPELRAEYAEGRLRLSGKVTIPEARLDLEQLDQTVAASDDVVVLDPREGREERAPLPIEADLRVELGDKVTLKGFGFDGGLAGSVRVRERPGRPTTGSGSLTVRGRYRAYGQDLAIERGRLNYASSAIDDPALDLRVGRRVGSVEVGLEVRGSARDPSLSVWSDPVLDQGEALSYLLLGRPLRGAGSGDSEQLTEAAVAVGGNLLAARLGARLGFDTFEVANSESLGGAAFTVGKYLSPRLHIGYGIALFGTGQVLSLKYLLTERFDIELESGDESRAAINYRIER
jgi:translocation and assembly module TamB